MPPPIGSEARLVPVLRGAPARLGTNLLQTLREHHRALASIDMLARLFPRVLGRQTLGSIPQLNSVEIKKQSHASCL